MQTLTKTLTGAQILVKTLKDLGVDTIFGYPGGIVLSVYDELFKQNDIKHYLVRHEQAAVHAAEGYARVSGKCGVAIVTSGPGATNIVTGVADAYLDGTPLIVLTGQVMANLLHQDAFQEVDIVDITKSCTKKNFQVTDVKNLESVLVEAFNTAISGRQGPVVVDLTKNIFSETAEFNPDIAILNSNNDNCKMPDLMKVFKALKNAEKPLIIAGGGVIQADASSELIEFAHLLNIPVVSSMMGLGAFPANDKNYIGMIGIFGHPSANMAVRESDLVFAIGTRFNDRIRCCFSENELSKKLIHLDISKKEISRVIPSSIEIVGDAKEILTGMIEEYKKENYNIFFNQSWCNYLNELKQQNILPKKKSEKLHSFEVMLEIQNCLKDKAPVISTEVGQHQVWAARYLQFNEPRKFLTSGGLGTMGFGFPAAIGASVALNGQPVVCIAGDGSFQMNLQELATCVDYNIPVKVFIINNGYLGMVRQFQEKMCDERYFATKISSPDYIKLAESYGIKGIRVEKFEDIKPAVEAAYNSKSPFIVDFVVEPMEVL